MSIRITASGAVLAAALIGTVQADDPWVRYNITVERDVPAKMRDGITLFADVYRPSEPGRYPALLFRTPYNKTDSADGFVVSAVRHGYVVVLQDVRGQFRSEGEFNPYLQEVDDGHDSIEWVAAQPYVNGKVGTYGLSYPGAVQWMTAPTRPPHLVAMVPAMTFANSRHFIYQGGIFEAPILNWLLQRQVKARRERGLPYGSLQEAQQALAEHREEWLTYHPLRDLPVMRDFPIWRDWLDHPDNDAYWKPYDIESQHSQITVPALNVTAWNDDDYGQPGATRNFMGMKRNGGSAEARRGQRLLIGPWTHGVPTLEKTTFAGVDYGPNARFDYTEYLLRYFDYWLKGVDNGYTQEPPVRYFVMGDNVWRTAEDWPPRGTRATDLALTPDGGLRWPDDANQAGGKAATVQFVYDPRNPLRVPGDGAYYASGPRTTDWRVVTGRRDVAVFTSAPLQHDLEITGQILGKLWFSSTAADTDVSMRLLDVSPDGRTANFTAAAGMLRTRYRSTEHDSEPSRLQPNQPVELEINLGYTSYVVKAGHRLLAYVGGSVFPYVHPNTWEPFRDWSQAAPARQTIHIGPAYPSRVVVPVMTR
jgi:putative CocE/NonD family hydrolase